MTGTEILQAALRRLNYTDTSGEVDMQMNSDIARRALDAVNYVLADLRHVAGEEFAALGGLGETVPLSDDVCVRVMPWGVAMLIAESESDADAQAVMAQTYNRLRNSFPRRPGHVRDVMPKGLGNRS